MDSQTTKACTIEFKAKPEAIWYGEVKRHRVKVPELSTRHCDMHAFRVSRRFGSYANSVLFTALLTRALGVAGIGRYLWADEPLPSGVSIDSTGFLWAVKIELPSE